ncbi:MAG TPA: hypothetical protein VK796_02590 [Cytophaga sp.]|jgi:hypothetical protein|nr:hypothetical protein [Cytophaga sp.]
MKKIILLGSIATILIGSMIALMSFKTSASDTNGYLYVRVVECYDPVYVSSITIVDGTSPVKTVDLNTLRFKNQELNVSKILAALNEIKIKGYVLVSSSGGANEVGLLTNYVFEKK